jgi:hypothetical protein
MGKMAALVAIGSLAVFAGACSTSSNSTDTGGDAGPVNTFVYLDAGPATPVSPDGRLICPIGACNYQTQVGCDAGQMCHPQLVAPNAVSAECQPAGTKAAGESCIWLECQAGLFCAPDGYCRHLCCGGDWSVCASKESCTESIRLQAADAGSSVSASVSVCEPVDSCDVLDPNSCPTNKSCYIVDSRAGVKCLPTGTALFAQGCSSTNLCAAGFTCVSSANGQSGNCRRLCRAVTGGGVPACPASEGYCSHFVRDPAGVGECTPMF